MIPKRILNKIDIKAIIITLLITTLFHLNSTGEIIEFKNKHLLLLFDDINYRFTLQRELIPSKEFSKDLLFFNIPPTSFITIKIDNISYNFNEGRIITPPTRSKEGSLFFECDIQGIIVTTKFTFTLNTLSKEEDGLIIKVEVENSSTSTKNIGIRYLLDTIFGENEAKPKFYLEGRSGIDYELLVNQNNMISYFISSSDINGVNNLYITWNPSPDRIIFSNWRRLSLSSWDIDPSPFLKYKFSENSSEDCAVAIFFENIQLKPKDKAEFEVIISTTLFSRIDETTLQTNTLQTTQLELQQEVKPNEKETTSIEKPQLPQQISITNYVFITNEVVQQETSTPKIVTQVIQQQNATLTQPTIITQIIIPQTTQSQELQEIKQRLQTFETKLEEVYISIDKVINQLSNIQTQQPLVKNKEIEKDIKELQNLKNTMIKLSKTLDTLEERIAIINKYIELRRKYSNRKIIVYSKEEYQKDLEIIEELSEILDEIAKRLNFRISQ